MVQLIDKDALAAEIKKLKSVFVNERDGFEKGYHYSLNLLISFLDTLEIKDTDLKKEIHETAEAFAKIIRANLTGIDKDVQYQFEQLYKEITGERMYQGYSD